MIAIRIDRWDSHRPRIRSLFGNLTLIVFLAYGLVTTGCSKSPGRAGISATASAHASREPAGSKEIVPRKSIDDGGSAFYSDMTEKSGIQFSYSNGRSAGEFAIIESLGGGVGTFDFDLDGNLDVMFSGGGTLNSKMVSSRTCGLFRNLGQWQFRDETANARAAAQAFFTHGIHPGDFDGDGFDDLAISGYGGVQMLHNKGDGTFESLAPLITNSAGAWSSSLAWADLDNNGHLDLYVTHYVDWSWQKHPICPGQNGVVREVCAPREFAGMADAVYFNDGQPTWRRESSAIGLEPAGKGLGVVIGDLNDDGFLDIYVANDTTDNFLYINDGSGKFSNSAVLAGVAGDDAGVSTGSMGVSLFDATGDRLPDLFVTNFERELMALYRNEGAEFFGYISRQAGFAAVEATFVGFGTVPIDFDLDGDLDVVVANGHVSYQSPHAPYRQTALIFENQSMGRFKRIMPSGYFAKAKTGRGLASGDLDNDGAVDLVFSNLEDPVAVLKSVAPTSSIWHAIRLVGNQSNRSAIGAKVTLDSHGDTRFLCGGGSYLSHSDRKMVFYTANSGSSTTSERTAVSSLTISVAWPSSLNERFAIKANAETVVREGTGVPTAKNEMGDTKLQ